MVGLFVPDDMKHWPAIDPRTLPTSATSPRSKSAAPARAQWKGTTTAAHPRAGECGIA